MSISVSDRLLFITRAAYIHPPRRGKKMRRRSPAREETVIAHSLDHIRRQGVTPYWRHSSTESRAQYRNSRVQLHDYSYSSSDASEKSNRSSPGVFSPSYRDQHPLTRTPVAISSGVSCTGVEIKQTAYYFRWLSVVVGNILRFF